MKTVDAGTLKLFVGMLGLAVILLLCLQGSVGAILSRKDDTDTQDIVCDQLGKTDLGSDTSLYPSLSSSAL